MRPVGVTGIGVRCAGAGDAAEFWRHVVAGQPAVDGVDGLELGTSVCRIGGQMKDLPIDRSSGSGARLLELLVDVTAQAVLDAGLDATRLASRRTGIVLGQSQGSLNDDSSAYFMHASADALAGRFGALGPRLVVSTACTAGAAAIALAAERIATGDADIMLAGGIDELAAFTWQGFTSLQSLSPNGCSAYSASDGLVLGEGAGIFVLQPLEDGAPGSAVPLAQLLGWGFSADAHHITAPDPSGEGAVLAMERAVRRAGIDMSDVDYVCGHGTGTRANDTMEVKAVRRAFGARAPQVPLSSIKPMIGHTLGAAGAIEAAASVFALRDGILPPTLNVTAHTVGDLDIVPNASRTAPLDVVMSNNYAFGGNNSSLVFGRARATDSPGATPPARDVTIVGVGARGAVGSGFAQWRDALLEGRSAVQPLVRLEPGTSGVRHAAEMPDLAPAGVAAPSEWRHLDPLSRLALTVARQAWNDAGLKLSPAQRSNVAVVYGSGTGPVTAIHRFQASIAAGAPSPVHFPNTVYTAAPGHVCRALGLRGPTTTFTSGGLAALHALEYAAQLVARGEVDQALVIGAEELAEWHLTATGEQQAYLATSVGVPFGKNSAGTNLGAAGVAFVLEATELAVARQARSYGRVLGCSTAGDATGSLSPDPSGSQWVGVIRDALDKSGASPDEVAYVAAAANGVQELDALETGVLARALGRPVTVSAPKSVTGETLGASGGIAVLAALVALDSGLAPPTAGLTDPVGAHRVQHAMRATPLADGVALANAYCLGGNYATAVLAR